MIFYFLLQSQHVQSQDCPQLHIVQLHFIAV